MRAWLVADAVMVSMLVAAAPAGAAQIGIGNAATGPVPPGAERAIHMDAAPGEANDVTVDATDAATAGEAAGWPLTVTVTDPGATFEATPPIGMEPCEIVDAHTARCTASADTYFMQATIRLGDGDNRLRFAPGSIPLREWFTGGDGADDIATGPFVGDVSYRWASDTGGGNDTVHIGAPVRSVFGYSPIGAISGGLALYTGAGDDTVTALNGAFDEVNCGSDADTLVADAWDIESVYVEPGGSCETRVLPGVE